jgi:hypothetical protein
MQALDVDPALLCEVPHPLVVDCIGPASAKKTRLRKLHDEAPQTSAEEDIRIEDCGERRYHD